ncbi:hypothetical protein D3C81_1933840 [compost metagenome]
MTGELTAIVRRRRTTGRPVIAAGGDNPVTGVGIVRAQKLGSDSEVGAGIEGIAGARVAVRMITQVSLSKPDIYALGIVAAECFPECGTRLVAPGKPQR